MQTKERMAQPITFLLNSRHVCTSTSSLICRHVEREREIISSRIAHAQQVWTSGRWGGMCEAAAAQLRETEKVFDPQVRF